MTDFELLETILDRRPSRGFALKLRDQRTGEVYGVQTWTDGTLRPFGNVIWSYTRPLVCLNWVMSQRILAFVVSAGVASVRPY